MGTHTVWNISPIQTVFSRVFFVVVVIKYNWLCICIVKHWQKNGEKMCLESLCEIDSISGTAP